MANVANNLLMLGLSNIRRKLFDLQAFHKQAHILNFTGIIIYFCGTYYLYALLLPGLVLLLLLSHINGVLLHLLGRLPPLAFSMDLSILLVPYLLSRNPFDP